MTHYQIFMKRKNYSMPKTFTIQTPRGKRTIGPGNPVFIVAEMSGNHGQNFNKAIKIIKAAANAGADAIKLQTYTPDTMTIDSKKKWFMERSRQNPKEWKGMSLYELYQRAYTPWEWHPRLQKIAESIGLVFFSTPFDESAVDFLHNLNVPCYKIASYEFTDIPLVKKAAQTKKPLILSAGFATKEEIAFTLKAARRAGARAIALLHCLTSYAKNQDVSETNLATMLNLKDRFGVICGLSDNNGGIEIPYIAALLGASVIEKHVTVDRGDNGLDARFSLTPKELKDLVTSIRTAEKAVGKIRYGPQNALEKDNLRFRRSLFVVQDIKKGELFTHKNVRVIRPGYGLAPRYFEKILGRRAADDCERGTPLTKNLITGSL